MLAQLHALTGKVRYRDRAEQIVAAFSGEIGRNFYPMSTLLNATELLERPVQIVIVGRRDEPAAAALLEAANRESVPTSVLAVVADGSALPADHPAHGKTRVDGKPAAYVCVGPTCSLPVTDPAQLATALRT